MDMFAVQSRLDPMQNRGNEGGHPRGTQLTKQPTYTRLNGPTEELTLTRADQPTPNLTAEPTLDTAIAASALRNIDLTDQPADHDTSRPIAAATDAATD
jgi:hypothetical protein